MSTSQTLVTSGPSQAGGAPAGNGSLLRAEVHRFTARRFIRLLVALALVGFVVGIGIALTQFAKVTPERLEQARAEQAQFREMCLADPNIPEGIDEDEWCPVPSEDELQFYIGKQPFDLRDELPAGAVGVGVATAALAFLVGATYIGAEWSTRSIVALLFWEPRRLRVLAVKSAVAILASVVLGLVGQVLWQIGAQVLGRARGSVDDLPAGFWGDVLAVQGRAVLLVLFAGLLGFGLANLIRNTGAALGVAFVYFAIVESAVRGFRPRWSEYLFSENAGALVTDGGITIYVDETVVSPTGELLQGREILVSNLQGAVTLTLICFVVIAVGTYLFQKRDLH